MPFFRRSFDPNHALARPAAAHDLPAIASLGYQSARRYLTSTLEEALDLVAQEPTAVLEYEGRVVAAAQAGWRVAPNAWLRSILIDSRIEARAALPPLIGALHQLLPVRGISAIYVTLDEWSAPWLRRPLDDLGYEQIMSVIGYDKLSMAVPSEGNPGVVVRQARADDLQAVLQIDMACFPTPWVKGEEILGPALISAPYFSVAEFSGTIIGYTYVTIYQDGRHAHLVRIATVPTHQGSGVGVRLLAEVVRFCRHREITLLSLNTQDYNQYAQRLYEWFGFERTGEIQAVLGSSVPTQR